MILFLALRIAPAYLSNRVPNFSIQSTLSDLCHTNWPATALTRLDLPVPSGPWSRYARPVRGFLVGHGLRATFYLCERETLQDSHTPLHVGDARLLRRYRTNSASAASAVTHASPVRTERLGRPTAQSSGDPESLCSSEHLEPASLQGTGSRRVRLPKVLCQGISVSQALSWPGLAPSC